MALKEWAFRAARSSAAGAVVRFGFAHAAGLLPLTVVERGRRVAVFEHPRPTFGSRHHIAVPLVAVPDVVALAHPRHAALRSELVALLVATDGSVLVNAGPRQDVGQVHFHLTDDPWPAGERRDGPSWSGWDEAVRGLTAVPGVEDRFAAGCSLLRPSGGSEVLLV